MGVSHLNKQYAGISKQVLQFRRVCAILRRICVHEDHIAFTFAVRQPQFAA
jgi:hypothetical protein